MSTETEQLPPSAETKNDELDAIIDAKVTRLFFGMHVVQGLLSCGEFAVSFNDDDIKTLAKTVWKITDTVIEEGERDRKAQ